MKTNPGLVKCTGTGLSFGYFNRPITADIDTREAGPGELTVFCDGRERSAFCQLRDHKNGTFTLVVRAQDIGLHRLNIHYDGFDVPGSPFTLRVSAASLVRIDGLGLHDGLLTKSMENQGEFRIDTQDAGPGDVKVRIGGPPGQFKLNTKKKASTRQLVCRYNPRTQGLYTVHVLWNGDHVPGSPYRVFLARTHEELDDYRKNNQSSA